MDPDETKRDGRWKLPEGGEPWLLGLRTEWPILEQFLDSSRSDDFFVHDEDSERNLEEVRKVFNNSSDDRGTWGVVHHFFLNFGGDNAWLLQRLLALGIEPDLEDSDGARPSHFAGVWARVEGAKVLSSCRPSLTAKYLGETPRDAAAASYPDYPSFPFELRESQMKLRRPEVRKLWEELEKSGFPSLPRMAFTRQWWAVKNLSRRRLLTRGEILEKYDGRTAVEWALAYGETEMAEELRYFSRRLLRVEERDDFHGLPSKVADIEKSVVQLRVDVKKVSDSTACAVTAVANVGAEASRQHGVVTEYMTQLRAELTEMRDELKEKEKEVTERLDAVDARVQKIDVHSAAGGHKTHKKSNIDAGGVGHPGTQPDSGDASSSGAAAGRPNAFVTDLVRQVEALARDPLQSLEFFFDLKQLLEKKGKPPQP